MSVLTTDTAPRVLKTWLARNNVVIMAVLMLIIGVKLVENAISGFST